MPASPALRYSPRREHRAENHKRGRSFEGTLISREKDDDLALFNEMQSKERESFLLQSSDDLEDTFSTKLRQFSDFKLGISIPARGESSELLNVEGEKNDYDWLLTPPDTPLFPSLDDEPQTVNVSSRGRPRSQPITISRQSTMEKSYRSSRGSASPNRLSPSPRSGNSSLQSRGRPSSAPQSSPPLGTRPATPSRRPSPPPAKPSTPPARSSTPTPGRSTRGISPVKTNRGNSASPKIRAWQSNIPGFSSEAPPNLRTSLTDRPASYVRGSSPASRNSRESGYRYGRQSMSPTASRSSHSQDRDRVSSNSRSSVASSGDDDVDSLQSIHVGSLDRLAPKRAGMLSGNRVPALSKKPARILSPSSAPKRSFDSALRQMDHRKSPQNMFRPLLSGVPSSTFYAGKATSIQRPFMSMNSSVSTQTNAIPAQGTSFAPDVEGNNLHLQEKTANSDAQDEIFAFDKADLLTKDVDPVDDFEGSHATECEPHNSEEFSHHEVDFSEVDSHEITLVCSECGCRYRAIETVETDNNLCPDCRSQLSLIASGRVSDEHEPFDKTQPSISEPQSRVFNELEAEIAQKGDSVKLSQTSHQGHNRTFSQESPLSRDLIGKDEKTGSHRRSGSDFGGLSSVHSSDFRSLKMDISEGAGISVLLKRSNSTKGPVVQSRTFIASSITYDDFGSSSLRGSVGHGSFSASSSIDLGSNRQMETRVQRQLSGKNLENYRYDIGTRPQSTESFVRDMKNDGIETATENNEANVSNAYFAEQNSTQSTDASISGKPAGIQSEENSVASIQNPEHSLSHENEDVLNNSGGVSDVQTTNTDQLNDAGVPLHSSLASISEIEVENCRQSASNSENDDESVNSEGSLNEVLNCSVPTQSDKGECSVMERSNSGHLHGILEDSTVTLQEGSKSRSLTLEEATDAILFCSSIVHDLAYQAATIAIEKEDSISPFEGSRPTVTILGKSTADRKDSHNRTPPKRPSKSHKVKHKRLEVDPKSPSRKPENDENANESMARNVGVPNNVDSSKPPKLESKCNCSIM